MRNLYISNSARAIGLSIILVLLNACTLKNPPAAPAVLREGAPGVTVPEKWKSPAEAEPKIADNWLTRFQDPQLQALVEEGLRNSPDLAVAAARMEAAEGAIKGAASKLYPEIAARGALTQQSDGRLFEGIATGAAAGVLWEIDLWGRVRAARAAARETYGAQAADYEFARQSLAAAIARSWFLVSQAYEQRELARGSVWAVIAVNAVWTVDSIALLVSGWVSPNLLGQAFIVMQAIAVGIFAELQFIGLRKSTETLAVQ